MNIRCRGVAAVTSLVLAVATPAGAGDSILAVTGKVTAGETNLTLTEIA